MEYKEQMPNDDLISALYLFVEMVHGKLPWRSVSNLEKIKKLKKGLQDEPPIVVDDTSAKSLPIDLRYLPRAFQMLGTFNPL
jgi:transcription antitermination factor NusG